VCVSAPGGINECYPRHFRALCHDEAEPWDVQYRDLEKRVVDIREMPQQALDGKAPCPANIPYDSKTLVNVFRSVTVTGRKHLNLKSHEL